uniref:Uncharacterized protein n=1 Tax=Hyaloperonospora arabidopsidis (strain Emoy2) TaxID=559515 RepID=M4B3I9_HYAAE
MSPNRDSGDDSTSSRTRNLAENFVDMDPFRTPLSADGLPLPQSPSTLRTPTTSPHRYLPHLQLISLSGPLESRTSRSSSLMERNSTQGWVRIGNDSSTKFDVQITTLETFDLVRWGEEHRLSAMSMCFRGAAFAHFKYLADAGLILNYARVCESMRNRFGCKLSQS